MADRMRSGRIAVPAALLIAALLVPLPSGPGSDAAAAPGCTAVGLGFKQCSYVTGGGRIEIVAATTSL